MAIYKGFLHSNVFKDKRLVKKDNTVKVCFLELPYPPSVNHYWYRNGNRSFLGKKGKQFREDVQTLYGGCTPHEGRLQVEVMMYPPDRRKRDVDNVLKPLLDALEHADIFLDDAQIDALSISRGDIEKGGRITVAITEIAE